MPPRPTLILPNGDPWVPKASTSSFDNATRGRGRPGSHAPLASPNAHRDQRTLEALIRDCEALARNNHLVRAMLTAKADMIVGHRPTVEARTSDNNWNRETEKRFLDWSCEACDNAGQLSLNQYATAVVKAWDTAGGLLIHKLAERGRVRMEAIEVARLRNPGGKPDTRTMHAGVELTEGGRPVRYHVADWSTYGTFVESKTTEVDASNAWLLNNPRLLDANQHRTEPGLASVVDRLETLDRAVESTFGAYELATYIALFIERADPQQNIEDQMAQAAVQAGLATSTQDAIERGVWQPLGVMQGRIGEKVTQIKPEFPSTSFDQLFWTELHTIAAALDLPLEIAFMRFIRNWSASRSAVSVAWRAVEVYQRVLVDRFLRPVYRWWLANEQISGRIAQREDWRDCEWFMPTMPMLDPKQELEAQLMALGGGLKLHETALRETGQGDRATFITKWDREQQENRAIGLRYAQPVQVNRSETVEAGADDGTEGAP